MAPLCTNCSRQVLFTFVEVVTQAPISRLRSSPAPNSRTRLGAFSTSSHHYANVADSDPATPIARPSKTLKGWQQERRSIFGNEESAENESSTKSSNRKPRRASTRSSNRGPTRAHHDRAGSQDPRKGPAKEPHMTLKQRCEADRGHLNRVKHALPEWMWKMAKRKEALRRARPEPSPQTPGKLLIKDAMDLPWNKKGRLANGSKDRWRRREEQKSSQSKVEDDADYQRKSFDHKSARVENDFDSGNKAEPLRSRTFKKQEPKDAISVKTNTTSFASSDLGPDIEAELAGERPSKHQKPKDIKPEYTKEFKTKSSAKPESSPYISPNAPDWLKQREAIKRKHSGAAWDPIKKLSPDAVEGVRRLHGEDPVLWSTPNLADHFKVSPEAIRRIIKSKWRPNEEEKKAQDERWIKRGEAIWDRYVELGLKAPRKWRGLNPIEPKKTALKEPKVAFKPEEWSRDQKVDIVEDIEPALGTNLSGRIV